MKHLTHVASRFVNTPLMIHPPKLEVIIKAIGPRLGIDPEAVLARRVPMDATATLMSRYEDAGDERDYSVIDGIAVIPVQGTLLKKESFISAWSGSSSYEQIQRQMVDAVADAGVSAILLDIDSPGGETSGCFDLADYIFSVRDEKPVWAVANDIALSAAYAIASSASKIYLNRTGAVGSIGVYALHMDQSGFDKEMGVKYTYVFAGAYKVDVRMVSRPTRGTNLRLTASCATRRTVQRARPSGGLLHTIAIKRCFWLSLSTSAAPGRCFSYSARSKPPC
jgi:ClpP class serine protease